MGILNSSLWFLFTALFKFLYLRSTQVVSALKQEVMHSEPVGSQLVIHVNVSSTHTSLQTPFSSKSLENTK